MTTAASPASETTDPLIIADTGETVVITPDESAPPSSADTPTPDAKEAAPLSLRDVVQNVVTKTEVEPEAPSATKAEVETPAVAPAAEGETDADVPFHEHPRWKQRTEELKGLRTEVEALKPGADNYRQITDFMAASSLQPDDVAQGFVVMGQIKSGDPAQLALARDYFVAGLKQLDEQLGVSLPADLQTQVDDGLVDLTIAQELARTRASESYLKGQRDQTTAQAETKRQTEQVETLKASVVEAVNAWEVTARASDPDFAKKADLIDAQARAIIQRTDHPPANADEAVMLVKAAYAEVNARLSPFAPKPKAITPAPAGLSARVSTAPASLKDAIRAAVS